MKNGFQAIYFEYSYVLDSYFIHGYIIIIYRSSSITGKIHQLSPELCSLISVRKMVSGRYLLNTLVKLRKGGSKETKSMVMFHHEIRVDFRDFCRNSLRGYIFQNA